MALVYRSFFSASHAPLGLVEAIDEYQALTGGPGVSELCDSAASHSAWATLRRSDADGLSAEEFVLERPGDSQRRVTAIRIQRDDEHYWYLEDELVEVAGTFSEMPSPDPLIAHLLNAQLESSPSDHEDHEGGEAASAWSSMLPEVVFVGDHALAGMEERVLGMAHIRVESVQDATLRFQVPLVAGSVIVVDSSDAVRLVLPRTVCQLNVQAAGRRLQREVLSCLAKEDIPSVVTEAIRTIRLSGGADTDWVSELERQINDNEQLQRENRALARQVDDAWVDAAAAAADREDALRRIRFLERTSPPEYASTYGEVDEEPPAVSSFDELFVYASEFLPYLWLNEETRSTAVQLNERPEGMYWAQLAWSALEALNDYAHAKNDDQVVGDFYTYCVNAPAGWRSIPPGQVAMHESESTMQNSVMREARAFRVPSTVHTDELLVMEPHIKVVKKGSAVPRIHFFDDTQGWTRKILVGYVGPHLPISSQN